MEFELIRFGELDFEVGTAQKFQRKKVMSLKKTCNSRFLLASNPVVDTRCPEEGGNNYYWGKTIDVLFGDSDLTRNLRRGPRVRVMTELTLTSANTKKLAIKIRSGTPGVNEIDVFEELLKLQETLPPNSIGFNLSAKAFQSHSRWRDAETKKVIFKGKGLKLKRDEDGSASLEMPDTLSANEFGWKDWNSKTNRYSGWLSSLSVRLDMAAVVELYYKHLGRDPVTPVLGTPTDVIFFVGGNKDKEKAIKCHKSTLTEISPVFAAMFRADMLEAKEGTLEIVDFSEDVIQAFVEFAYRGNLQKALISSEMTFDLLKLADKYEVQDLMDKLLHLIWCMPFRWFSVDVAFNLFYFVKDAGKYWAEAKSKAWKTLKWYARKNPEKFVDSQEAVRLCESPRAVMNLVVLLLNKCD